MLMSRICLCLLPTRYFFSNVTSTTEIYTLSLHDALPIFLRARRLVDRQLLLRLGRLILRLTLCRLGGRSEEHTSELQSLRHLVCRLLLEKKKTATYDAIGRMVDQQRGS